METQTNDMLLTFMNEFKALMPTQLPVLLSEKRLDSTAIYDDYAQLTYHLDRKLTIAEVADMFEDQANLKLLYHKKKSDGLKGWQICCAFSNPCFKRMYKFNAEADDNGIVHTITVYIFDDLGNMRGYLLRELRKHRASGGMEYEMDEAELLNTFF